MLFLGIDMLVAADFIAYDEAKLGRAMTYPELVSYLRRELQVTERRSCAILEALGYRP